MEPITLKDALMKIRELKSYAADMECHYEKRIDDMTDALNMMKKEHIEELKKVRAVAKEREEVLMEQINPEKVKQQVLHEVRGQAQAEIQKLREELTIAEEKAASSAVLINTLQQDLQQRREEDETNTEQREAEMAYLKQTLMRDQEESAALRKALERERVILASERDEWKTSQAEAADALAAYRQRAAKAELNARWVANIQQSLQAKDTSMKAAISASELLLDLLEAIRLTFGPIPVDAAINKALRTVPSVGKAATTGVDVASLLGTGLRGFSETRAAANSRSSRSASPVANEEPVLPHTPERGITSPVLVQKDFLIQAKQLQMEAAALSQTRQQESPRWSPSVTATRPVSPSPQRGKELIFDADRDDKELLRPKRVSTSPSRGPAPRKPKQYAQIHQQQQQQQYSQDTWNWSSQSTAYPLYADIPQAVYAAV